MNKLFYIISIFLLVGLFTSLEAQSKLDYDKVYVSYDTPSQGLVTYQFNVVNNSLQDRIQTKKTKIESKYASMDDVMSMDINLQDMMATLVIEKAIADDVILKLARELNLKVTSIVEN